MACSTLLVSLISIVAERHSAVVTDVLRFDGLTHGGIEILFRTDCADLQVNGQTIITAEGSL